MNPSVKVRVLALLLSLILTVVVFGSIAAYAYQVAAA